MFSNLIENVNTVQDCYNKNPDLKSNFFTKTV